MAGVRQHPEPLRRRGRGSAGDRPSPGGPGPSSSVARGFLIPVLSPLLSALQPGIGKGWHSRAERCEEGAGGLVGRLEASRSSPKLSEASGKWRTLGFTLFDYQTLTVCFFPPFPPAPGFPSNPKHQKGLQFHLQYMPQLSSLSQENKTPAPLGA